MATIQVTKPDRTTFNIGLLSGSQEEYNLMGETKAVIVTESATPLNIPVGSMIAGKLTGESFWLVKSADIVKKNTRDYTYTITFQPLSALLQYIIFIEQANDKTNRLVSFTATMRPIEFVKLIIEAIKERLGVTVNVGVMNAEDTEKNLSFDSTSVYDALNMISEAYSTEWQLRYTEGMYYLDLGLIEYDKENPLNLGYGKNSGFLPGVSFSNGEQPPIKRVYVQGGERNIDYNTYIPYINSDYRKIRKSSCLILPYTTFIDLPNARQSEIIKFDGKAFGQYTYIRASHSSTQWQDYEIEMYNFPAESGFDNNNARSYRIDPNGLFIENANPADGVMAETAFKNEEIYPSLEINADECEINYGSGDDNLGYFTVLHKLRKLSTAVRQGTLKVYDCEYKNGSYNPIKINEDPNSLVYVDAYKMLGTHTFNVGDKIEPISNLGLYHNRFGGGGILLYACKLVGNNYYDNGAQQRIYMDENKVVIIGVSTCTNSYVFTDYFSTSNTGSVDKTTENFPNYQDCIIAGEIPSIVFQSGMLAGKEFKLRITQSGNLDNGSASTTGDDKIIGFAFVKKTSDSLIKTYDANDNLAITDETTHVAFRMNREEIDNYIMADDESGYTVKNGDLFAVFNVAVPNEYLAKAEYELLKAAVRFMYENEQQVCNINGSLDENFLRNNQGLLKKIRLGEYVYNPDFNVNVRITQVTNSLERDFDVKLSFSEGRKKESFGSEILRKL